MGYSEQSFKADKESDREQFDRDPRSWVVVQNEDMFEHNR